LFFTILCTHDAVTSITADLEDVVLTSARRHRVYWGRGGFYLLAYLLICASLYF